MQTIPLTKQGAEKLREELNKLKKQRPIISQTIAEARALGDLKENAEYHAAREQQGLTEARIRDLEYKIANAQIIDVASIKEQDRVVFGATVHLINIETDEELHYQIVGEEEADIKEAKISVTSPIARGLIGKEIDDIAEIITPGGVVEYEIVKVEYI
ncbi:MAG: transcription elongation factor GreA [Gammaproteobacteria bacterium]|nr:transcription elongation factor GreA [Gammaproteobacteria bacterium]